MSSTAAPSAAGEVGSESASTAAVDPLSSLTASLSAVDGIFETGISSTLDSFLSLGGPPKRAVQLLSQNYKGRPDMINLILAWNDMADGHTSAASEPAPSAASSSLVTRLVQRSIFHRFDPAIADEILSRDEQPAWLEQLTSGADPATLAEWAPFFTELMNKYPSSLFLKLCVGLVQERAEADALVGATQTRLGSDGMPVGPIVNVTTKATILNEFDKCQQLIGGLIHAIFDRILQKVGRNSGGGTKRKYASITTDGGSNTQNEFASKLASMPIDMLRLDLHRLAAASEYTYLYTQRVMTSLYVNAPKEVKHIIRRIQQDLSEYTCHPPAVLLPGAPSSSSSSGGDVSLAASILPIDLYLLGLKSEWSDCVAALQGFHRTGQLSTLDINKLYAQFTASGNSSLDDPLPPPPVVILRERRFIQALVDAVFKTPSANSAATSTPNAANASMREKQIYLLAYATSIQDERHPAIRLAKQTISGASLVKSEDGVDGGSAGPASLTIDRTHFDSTRVALSRLVDFVSGPWGLRPSGLLRHIHAHIKSSIVGACATTWMLAQLTDPGYYESTFHATLTPFFLHLLGSMVNLHPLLLGQVFDGLSRVVRMTPNMDPFLLIQYRKTLWTMLLHVCHRGCVGPTLDLLKKEIQTGLDHSLIRHFIVQLLHTTAPPYSREFLEKTLQLLELPQTFKALNGMLVAHVKRHQAGQANANAAAAVDSSATTTAAAAAVLAAAHVAPNTKAALRILAAAELHGELAPAASSSNQPPSKKIKTEDGSASSHTLKDERASGLTAGTSSKPLLQVGVGSDSSDSSVLDFCSRIHHNPDLLRHAPIVRGFDVSSEGVLNEFDNDRVDDSSSPPPPPIPNDRMQIYMQTIEMYLAIKRN